MKYASDPYWGEKAANIIWRLDQNGGSRDADAYTIGIKDTLATGHTSVNVRRGSSTSEALLYKTGAASNYAVLIQDLAAENSFYRIQSDAVLNADRASVNTGTGKYDYDNMYAYISSSYVTVVNQGKTVDAPLAKVLESIYISQAPARTTYTAGETFDAAGMVVMARWNDGTESDVTSEVTYSTDALSEGTGSITVSYTNEGVTMTADQAVTVTAAAPPTQNPDEPSGDNPQPPAGTAPTPDEPTGDNTQPPAGAPTPDEPSADDTQVTPAPDTPAADPGQQPTDGTPNATPGQQPSDGTPNADPGQQPTDGTPDADPGQQPSDPAPKTDSTQQGGTSSEAIFQSVAGTGDKEQNSAVQAGNENKDTSASANGRQNTSAGNGQERKAPKTGDESNLMLWSILFVISMSGMISVIQRKRESAG